MVLIYNFFILIFILILTSYPEYPAAVPWELGILFEPSGLSNSTRSGSFRGLVEIKFGSGMIYQYRTGVQAHGVASTSRAVIGSGARKRLPQVCNTRYDSGVLMRGGVCRCALQPGWLAGSSTSTQDA